MQILNLVTLNFLHQCTLLTEICYAPQKKKIQRAQETMAQNSCSLWPLKFHESVFVVQRYIPWIMLQPLLTYVCWLMPPSTVAWQQLAHTTTSICSPYPHLVKSKDIQEIYHRSPEGTSYSVDCVYNAWSDWFLWARSIVGLASSQFQMVHYLHDSSVHRWVISKLQL